MKIKKLSILFIIFTFVILSQPFTANAVVNWTKDSNNPVLQTGDTDAWDEAAVESPVVVKDEDTYKMWYTGQNSSGPWQIGYATSSYGTDWTKYGSDPVLQPRVDKWDSAHVMAPWVIMEGSTYKMWYEGTDNADDDVNIQIGYATSSDGINWSGLDNPVLPKGGENDWDGGGVWTATVIKEGSTYKMWYVGEIICTDGPCDTAIGYATSSDGIIWEKYNDLDTDTAPYAASDPVINLGPDGSWDGDYICTVRVIKEGSIYRMWYTGEEFETPVGGERIGYAYSMDGINWRKYNGNPVIMEGQSGSFDDDGIWDPMVIKDGNTYKMWYSGHKYDGTTQIGYATSEAYPGSHLQINNMMVSTLNTSGGMKILVSCVPEGPSPLDINELKVEGPGGFSHTFTDDEIRNIEGWQFPIYGESMALVPSGTYTFSVKSNNALAHSNTLDFTDPASITVPDTGGSGLDMHIKVDEERFNDENYIGATTPTFRWKPYLGENYYYRVMVWDWRKKAVWGNSGPIQGSEVDADSYINVQVPEGMLVSDTPYHWWVEVLDTNNVWSAHNRSRSDWFSFYTEQGPPVERGSDFLSSVGFISSRSFKFGDQAVFWAKIHNLAPWEIDTTTNKFRVDDTYDDPFHYFDIDHDNFTSNVFRYFAAVSGIPANGDYDFYVCDKIEGGIDSKTKNFLDVSGLPRVVREEMTPFDNEYLPGAEPTLTWKSKGAAYKYRVKVFDWNKRRLAYSSGYIDGEPAGNDMSVNIPCGTLKGHSPYRWRVELYDGAKNSRTSSQQLAFQTGSGDSDCDGLTDDDETNIYGTNPNNPDTDDDGINDGDEVAYWGASWNSDPDGDDIINLLDFDSDNDGFSDGQEIAAGTDPNDPESKPEGRHLYDDFLAGYLDGQKWRKEEKVREVTEEKLASMINSRTGPEGQALNQTSFQSPDSINSIQAKVTVYGASLHNENTHMAAAQIEGFFYNASGGDIWAGVFIGDRGIGLEAWWMVAQNAVVIDEGNLPTPALAYNTQYLAEINYDGGTGITFKVLSDTYSHTYTGPARIGTPADNHFKSLTTGVWGNGDRGHGYVFADFDDVYINNNAEAYDDFTTAPLDPARWKALEKVREVTDEENTSLRKLRLNIQASGEDRQVKAPLKNSNTPYLEANVSVSNSSVLSGGAFGRARICGYFYNESRGPGSGYDYNGREGDVFAQVALELYEDSGLKLGAICRADRSNADGSVYTEVLATTVLFTNLSFNTEYTLSIKFTDTSLIFRCNGEIYTHNITTPVYEPSAYGRVLSSRIYSGASGSGYLKAYFDDVYIEAGKISGVVVDENNNSLENVRVTCRNEVNGEWRETSTGSGGSFELSGLSSGPWEFTVEPEVNTGLAWFVRDYYLNECEEKDLGTIKLQQGALVSGCILQEDAQPLPPSGDGPPQYWYGGKFEMGWGQTDPSNGTFAFRLPLGTYTLNLEPESGYSMVPYEINVTNVDETTYESLSLTAYDSGTGHTIEGSVTGDSPPADMELEVVAFLNSQEFTPDNIGGVGPMGYSEPDAGTGAYSLFVPPTDARDGEDVKVMLALWSEGDDGNESLTIVGVAPDVTTVPPPGSETVPLAYTSGGYTVDGYVKDSSTGEGIFFATVLLYNSAEEFVGFAETDHTGKYTFYNVPEGNYKVAVTHPDYPDDTEWSSGFLVDANVPVEDVFMGGGALVADFGSDTIGADGIYVYDGASWSKIANSDPSSLVIWGSNLVADFGSDTIGADGIYVYDGASWSKIAQSDPDSLVIWGSNLVADFGSDTIGADGIYVYDGASWSKIAQSDPDSLVIWGSNLVADFGSDTIGADGIYVYDGTTWSKIANSDPESLVVW